MRVDCGVETGATVTPFYNSLLAKIIAFGADREEARRRLVCALEATFVAGVTTNRDLFVGALRRREFVAGKATTDFIVADSLHATPPDATAMAIAALLFVERGGPPAPSAGWRASPLRLSVDGADYLATVRRQGDEWIVTVDGEAITMRLVSRDDSSVRISRDGVDPRRRLFARWERPLARFRGRRAALRRSDLRSAAARRRACATERFARRSAASSSSVEAKAGDRVRRGQALATVEAMKMQYSIFAPIDGVIAQANAVAGQQAPLRALLFAVEPHGD